MSKAHTNISLQYGAMRVEISPSMGGSILSFTSLDSQGRLQHWLRPAADNIDSLPQAPFHTGCFPLFPFSNRIANNRLSLVSGEYALLSNIPNSVFLHGHSWMGAWRVKQQDQARLVLSFALPHRDVSSFGWPFSYEAELHFVLDDKGLKVTLKLTNTSTTTMPAGMGLHPYFCWEEDLVVEANTKGMWLSSEENIPIQHVMDHESVEALIEGQLHRGLDNNFTQWDGVASIRWPSRTERLQIEASDLFRNLVVFSPPDEAYFCLEPVTHVTDAFNHPEWQDAMGGMQILSPNESLKGDIRFSIRP